MLPNLSGLASRPTGVLYGSIEEARKAENDEEFGADEDCPVCLNPLADGGKGIVVSNCRHKFHEECAKNWFEYNQKCAMCRNPIEKDELGKATPVIPTPEWDKYVADKRLQMLRTTIRRTGYDDEGVYVFLERTPRVAWTTFFPRKGYAIGFQQAQFLPLTGGKTGWDNDSLLNDSPVGPKAKLHAFGYVMFTMPPMVELQFYNNGVGFGAEEYWTKMIQRVEGVIEFMMDLTEDMGRRDAFDEYQQALFRWLSITELAVARTFVLKEIWDRDVKPMVDGMLPSFTDATARAEMQYDCKPWDYCSVYYLIETELDTISWILSYSRIEPASQEAARRQNTEFIKARPRISAIRNEIRTFVRDAANRAGVSSELRMDNNVAATVREKGNILARAWELGRLAGFRMGGSAANFFVFGNSVAQSEPERVHAPSQEEADDAASDIDDVKNAYRKRLTDIDGKVPDEAELQKFFTTVLLPGQEPAPRRPTTYFTPTTYRHQRARRQR